MLKYVNIVELHYLELSCIELPTLLSSNCFHLNILFSRLFSDILNSCYLNTSRLDHKEREPYKTEALYMYFRMHTGYFALMFTIEFEAGQVFGEIWLCQFLMSHI